MGISNQLRDIDRAFGVIASLPGTQKHSRSSSASPTRKAAPPASGPVSPTGTARCIRATPPRVSRASSTSPTNTASTSKARSPGPSNSKTSRYFAGFRSLATNGIDKPVLNVFRMFSMMSGDRLPATSDGAVAARRDR